jgi:hypothetical protein
MARMTRGPGPTLNIKETRGANDGAIREANGSKGKPRAGLAPGERGFNVTKNGIPANRDSAPLIEQGIARGSGDEAVKIAEVKRLETNMAAGEDGRVEGHVS